MQDSERASERERTKERKSGRSRVREGEREREERVCTRDRTRGRKIVDARATQIECVQRDVEAGEGGREVRRRT